MNKTKKNLKNAILIAIPFLLLISVVAIVINRGFYFGDFKNRVELKATSEDNSSAQSFISKLEDNSSLTSKIISSEKEDNTLILQQVSNETILEEANNLKSEDVTINLKEIISNKRSVLENYIWFSILTLIIASLSIFYIVLRKKERISLKELASFYIPYFASYFGSSIIYLGILSLASRLYYINEYHLIPLYIINILLSLLFFVAMSTLKRDEELTVMNISDKFFVEVKNISIPFLIFALTFIAALSVALGKESLTIYLALLLALFLIYLSICWIYLFTHSNIFEKNKNIERSSILKNLPTKHNIEQEIVNIQSRVENKQKLKSKTKSKNRR